MANHFTATIKVMEVEAVGTLSTPKRDVTEVANLTLRADTLEKLRNKLAAHVALIEE